MICRYLHLRRTVDELASSISASYRNALTGQILLADILHPRSESDRSCPVPDATYCAIEHRDLTQNSAQVLGLLAGPSLDSNAVISDSNSLLAFRAASHDEPSLGDQTSYCVFVDVDMVYGGH